MATSGGTSNPPAYAEVQSNEAGPPAYGGNELTTGNPEGGISYPELPPQQAQQQAQPQAAQGVPIGGAQIQMTQMLSDPNAAAMANAGQAQVGQPVVYMMQQPDGSLVQVQGVQPAVGQMGSIPQQQVVYQPQQAAIQSQTTTVVTQAPTNVNGGEGAAGGQQIMQVAVVQQQQPKTGYQVSDDFNVGTIKTALVLFWIFYIAQIYGTAVDSLVTFEFEDDYSYSYDYTYTFDFGYTELEISVDYIFSWYDSTEYYSRQCDGTDTLIYYEEDTWCELESRGATFEALTTIADVVGLVGLICLSNVMAKCCCNDKINVGRQILVGKICSIIVLICALIAVLVWEVDNPLYSEIDDDGYDYSWDTTLWIWFINIIGYLIITILLFQRKPVTPPVVPNVQS